MSGLCHPEIANLADHQLMQIASFRLLGDMPAAPYFLSAFGLQSEHDGGGVGQDYIRLHLNLKVKMKLGVRSPS